MRETFKTASFAATALVLLALAVWAGRTGAGSAGAFDDQGEPFFPEFTLPEQARSLEIVAFDRATGRPRPFKVAMADGRWVIPSHHGYPADARDRLARTAAGFIDLKKDTIRSDRPEDHAALGVLDPLEPSNQALEGVGTRVTLRDASGAPLADLILGKTVPNAEGQRFVRVPQSNRVYGVNLQDVEISTRFGDWIEPNLLGVEAEAVQAVRIDNYKLDPVRKTFTPIAQLDLSRPDPETPWALERPVVPPGRELDPAALDGLVRALADLEIVGVRRKPPGLQADLLASRDRGSIRLSAETLDELKSRGFHLVQGQLMSSEGQVQVETSAGILYVLRFGEVTFARGEALTAGSDDEQARPADGSASDDLVENRYLFVTAQFEPRLVPEPPAPRPKDAGELPDDVFARTPTEYRRRERDRRIELADAERAQAAHQRALAAGRARARALTDRFAGWYYVVPGDAYHQIVLDLDRLTRDPKAPAAPAELPPGAGLNLQGLPGH